MEIMLLIIIGYAVLFWLLKHTGLDDSPGETFAFFLELVPWLFLAVKLVNWLFGTNFSDEAWVYVWAFLVGAWTLVAIWCLIDEPRKQRKREERIRRILSGEDDRTRRGG